MGSRIMSVADSFTALIEAHPHRQGLTLEKTMTVLDKVAEASTLDPSVVSFLRKRQDEINTIGMATPKAPHDEYEGYSRVRAYPARNLVRSSQSGNLHTAGCIDSQYSAICQKNV